jgi:inosose dehydratase
MTISNAPGLNLEGRIAGAPISWGICEVPGWGLQLPARRVLAEMVEVGISATELGSAGYLGATAADVNAMLSPFDVEMIGGFVPVVLHDKSARKHMLHEAAHTAALLAAAGGSYFVTAVVVDADWSPRVQLDHDAWQSMADGFAAIDKICTDHGLVQALHPHVNTLVETKADVDEVLKRSPVQWTLDTGHLLIGGTDPVWFARNHADRVAHVHVKDVRMDIAKRLNAKERTLMEATQDGLFPPAGGGDAPIAETIAVLEAAGYDGWYVLEQDVAITGSLPPEGEGPINGVRQSIAYLNSLQ